MEKVDVEQQMLALLPMMLQGIEEVEVLWAEPLQ
jgi:hypothetical protein